MQYLGPIYTTKLFVVLWNWNLAGQPYFTWQSYEGAFSNPPSLSSNSPLPFGRAPGLWGWPSSHPTLLLLPDSSPPSADPAQTDHSAFSSHQSLKSPQLRAKAKAGIWFSKSTHLATRVQTPSGLLGAEDQLPTALGIRKTRKVLSWDPSPKDRCSPSRSSPFSICKHTKLATKWVPNKRSWRAWQESLPPAPDFICSTRWWWEARGPQRNPIMIQNTINQGRIILNYILLEVTSAQFLVYCAVLNEVLNGFLKILHIFNFLKNHSDAS